MDVTREVAQERARELLRDAGFAWQFFDDDTLELPWGWVFVWGPVNPDEPVAGGGPIAVLRSTGKAEFLGTALPFQELLAAFERRRGPS